MTNRNSSDILQRSAKVASMNRSSQEDEEAHAAVPAMAPIFQINPSQRSTRKSQLIQDFLFTDIMNHVEFLKYIQTLEKDDDLLLVHLLERLRLDANAPNNQNGQREIPIVPFYFNHQHMPRNALHIAMAYTSLKGLDGHQLNIYEQSYLTAQCADVISSILVLIAQVGFLSILIWQYYGTTIRGDASAEFVSLVSVALVSSMVFFKKGQQHWKACKDFNNVFQPMGSAENLWLLHINKFVNKYLCVVIFILNVWFVISSDNSVEAILNSVALFFILEIDDELAKDWATEKKEDEMAINVHDFIMEIPNPERLHVVRDNYYIEEGKEFRKDPTTNDQIKFYSGREKLYISLEEDDSEHKSIIVYEACHQTLGCLTTRYNRTEYTLSGPSASIFFKTIKDFKCIQNYKDIHD